MLSVGRNRTIAKHTGFRSFLWVGSSCWEEVALCHCKSCAFSIEAALLPNTLVSEVFCGLAHHVGKRWLSFIAIVQRPTQGPEHNRALLLLTSQRSILWQKGLQSVTCEFRQLYVTTCMWVQEYTMYPDTPPQLESLVSKLHL